ncbi:hypothetical protein [Azospirillum canadense]|uniref:hypothetical protein n=1 Tax=Azospirillum canadense TaxID=403962 RepID=UPI00222774CA|nr:hypothetical protein [Azospirillum canadense]MCW2235961.1 hypothetical protein [Azospirillum canadense]
MYYSELSGPNGTTSSVLQTPAAKKTTDGKSASSASENSKADDKKAASPAYTISQSMETLLDGLSGKKPAASDTRASDYAGKGTAGKGMTGGSGTGAQAMSDRAAQALDIMKGALDHSKGLAGAFEKAIDGMKSDLGSTLDALGMPKDRVDGVLDGFGDHLKDKLKSMDFSQMSMSMQEARSQFTIESRGIELTIQDGNKSVRISFAKSTLDFQRQDQSVEAALNADGSGSVAFGQTNTKVTGKSTGMIVRANGFSEDEIKGVLEKLNGMMAKGGGMSGSGVLKPTKSADGVMHLNLDLSQPVEGLTDGKAPAATDKAETPAKVDIKA